MVNGDAILSNLRSLIEGVNGIGQILRGGLWGSPYPPGAVPLADTSGNASNSQLSAVLPGAAGQTTYIEGFDVSSSGSTAAAITTVTVSDGSNLLLGWTYGTVAGATTMNERLQIRFPRPLPASGPGLSITVTCPALGTGNSHAIVNAYGFRV